MAIKEKLLEIQNKNYHIIHVDNYEGYVYAISPEGRGKYFPL